MKIYKEVKLNDINLTKRNYLFSFPERNSYLLKSIKKFGVLEPPLLYETQDGLVIIAGWGRIKASLSLGLESLPCLILKDPKTEKELLLLALHSNLFRPLNLVEKALFVKKASLYFMQEEWQEIFQLLAHPYNPKSWLILQTIGNMEEKILNLIVQERLNPQIFLFKEKFSEEEFLQLLDFTQIFGLSFSEQKNLVELAIDLKRLEKLRDLLSELRDLSSIEDFNKRKRNYGEVYMKYRYPYYRKAWAWIQKIKNKYSSVGIEINYSSFLEERELEIKINISSPEELREKTVYLINHGDELFSIFKREN